MRARKIGCLGMCSLSLMVSALVVVPGRADATIADRLVPVHDAADGVTAGAGRGRAFIRFGSRAALLYRGLAGRKAKVGCGDPKVQDDGSTRSTVVVHGPEMIGRAGYWWSERTLPRGRERLVFSTIDTADACFIATQRRRSDDRCLMLFRSDRNWCVRVIVALTANGSAGLEERTRTLELDLVFGMPLAQIRKELGDSAAVALDGPDASPPPGTIGVFQSTSSTVAVATLADGRRWFVRQDGDVFSTNVPSLSGRRGVTTLS
jgi:hypothetical protein